MIDTSILKSPAIPKVSYCTTAHWEYREEVRGEGNQCLALRNQVV